MRKEKAVARKVGPSSSKSAARLTSMKSDDVYRALRKIEPATCEQVILYLKERLPPGYTLREDPISGMFNQLCLTGKIVPTGKKRPNSSKHLAMLWRTAKEKETRFLKAFVGDNDKSPWPSPDTLLELKEVRHTLLNHPNPKVRKMFRKYRKGVLFKTELKDDGIKRFMRKYDEKGRRREDPH